MINLKRNKLLASLLIIFIFALFFLNDIPSKTYFNIYDTIRLYRNVNVSYQNMISNFKLKSYYESKRTELLNEISFKNYRCVVLQEQILALINKHSINNNISINNVIFTDAFSLSSEEIEVNDFINIQMVTIEFKSTYEDLLIFIKDIRNDEVDIAITNMKIINFDGDILFVSCNFNCYSLNV